MGTKYLHLNQQPSSCNSCRQMYADARSISINVCSKCGVVTNLSMLNAVTVFRLISDSLCNCCRPLINVTVISNLKYVLLESVRVHIFIKSLI